MSQDASVTAQIAELVELGRQFLDDERLEEAEHIFLGLRSITTVNFEVNKQLGILLATKGDFAGARAPLDDAVLLNEVDPVAFNVLSVCAFETGDFPAALSAAERAVRLRRTYPEAHNSRGNALLMLGRPKEAMEAFKAALTLTPRDPDVYVNLANTFEAMGRFAEALNSVERAIELEPGLSVAHVNRGNILQKLGRHRDALEAYDQALAIDPNNVDGHWNRGLCSLLLGDYELGWTDYEWRWRRGARETTPRGFAQPLWLGEGDLTGRTILLHAEQGLGDCIQFARYAPQVGARGARVILEVFEPLVALLSALPNVSELVRRGDPLPAFDLQCPLMSLPLALGQPRPSPEPRPYLRPDQKRVAIWGERLGPPGGLRIGITSSGSPTHGNDAQRSIPFATIAAHLPLGFEYHLLQKEVREDDRAALATRPDVTLWTEALGDFADTAALAEHLDLLITVDTSAAHLAGALGRPVWLLLPTEPDWRWALEGEATPWYGQMKLYRQAARGDWNGPLARIAADLRDL